MKTNRLYSVVIVIYIRFNLFSNCKLFLETSLYEAITTFSKQIAR